MKKIYTILITLLTLNLTACKGESNQSSTERPIPEVYNNTIYFLGSSTVENFGPSLAMWSTQYQLNTINLGKGGEVIDSMCIRIGALPAHAKFSNSELKPNVKNYFTADWGYDPSLKPFKAKISNVEGTIAVDSQGYYFESSQNIYIDSNQNFEITNLQEFVRNSVFVVNLGKNNLLKNTHGSESYKYVYDKSKECINWIKDNITPRIIILGHFSAVNSNENLLMNVTHLNQELAQSYPNNYFDLNQYLTNQEIWQDVNITPLPIDTDAQKLNTLAPSLTADSIHLNESTNVAVTNKLYESLKIKKWIQ